MKEHSLEVLRAGSLPIRSKLAFLCARWNGPVASAVFACAYRLYIGLAKRNVRDARGDSRR